MIFRGLCGLMIALVCVIAFTACGCRRYGPEKSMEWMLKRLTSDLELTEAQQRQFDRHKTEITIKAREAWVAHINTVDEISLQLRKDTFDQGRIQDIMSQNAARRQELSALFIARLAEFHSALTPEQRTLLARKIEKMNRWGKRHWRHS
jgi:Spy/CpxP family protein refolding chaperone